MAQGQRHITKLCILHQTTPRAYRQPYKPQELLADQYTAHVFRERSTGLVLAVYSSGEFESQIARLQSLDAGQLQRLRVENKMD